jgi:hypothetical protein
MHEVLVPAARTSNGNQDGNALAMDFIEVA